MKFKLKTVSFNDCFYYFHLSNNNRLQTSYIKEQDFFKGYNNSNKIVGSKPVRLISKNFVCQNISSWRRFYVKPKRNRWYYLWEKAEQL